MKLDPIKFAACVARLQLIGSRGEFGEQDVVLIHDTLISALPAHGEQRVNLETLREIITAAQRGLKIECIKGVRSLTGLGLKESKDLVESALPPSASTGGAYQTLRSGY